ncbi:MAG: F0F1 ATP synthase subunit A [Planctomycetaceae bacterium]
MAAGHEDIFHHVRDFPYLELPRNYKLHLPEVFGLQLTKFMVLQLVAAVTVFLIFRGLARRVADGKPAEGRWWNFWEALAVFIRDEVVRPAIGDGGHHGDHAGHGDHEVIDHAAEDEAQPLRGMMGMAHVTTGPHPADKYLPFVWSCFFYVLICNLLGAIPWLGSATAEINVTGALAVTAFGAVLIAGSRELGFTGFWLGLCPAMELPPALKIILLPMIWSIEVLGLFIKHGVLAVRLFANMMGGHTVIAVILAFIAAAAHSPSAWLYYLVLPSSILGQVAIGLLELFVAFLQAYVFAFLAALFIGTAIHPH